jgi:membrane protein YdbS with pleckstrin-like domain
MNCGKLVKDKTDQDSWFSAKPIEVGNLSYIIAGTELWSQATLIIIYLFVLFIIFVYIGGSWRFYRWVFALGRAMMNIK